MILALLTFAISVPAPLPPVDDYRMVEAIRVVENTQGWGSHTEYGPYQMVASVRRQVGGHDRAAAIRWLHVIEARLRARHVDVTPFTCAASWNGGTNCVIRGHILPSTWDYGRRVTAVYDSS